MHEVLPAQRRPTYGFPSSPFPTPDPFGNYLCQKLLECCNEEQRTAIVKKVARDLVPISLSLHGTRAAQKLLDTLSTQEQVEMCVAALQGSVVRLIKDINGNHVIQRCLEKLKSPENIQVRSAMQ